jgi:Predicted outer membrane lipoprotein
VRAVVDHGGKRCWIEHQEAERGNAGAAVAGAIIGGILGHQIGGGSGRDAATAIGAVAGAAIASHNAGSLPYSRDVRRCEPSWSGNVAYWDVTYHFRGRDYYTQMTYRPGPTITVNAYGEPRQQSI